MVARGRIGGQLALAGALALTSLLVGCFGYSCAECTSSALVPVYLHEDGHYLIDADDGVTTSHCEVEVQGESCVTVAPCTSLHPTATGLGVYCGGGVSWTPGAAFAVTTSNFPSVMHVRLSRTDGTVLADRAMTMHYGSACGCASAEEPLEP
jgi:hypothetical protein